MCPLATPNSGWTQKQLAKKEGKDRAYIARRLLFGRFLSFVPTGTNAQTLPSNLTERRFRSYWERTEGHNERRRINEVMAVTRRLMQGVLGPPDNCPEQIGRA
jgi:hypothetical protein